MALTISDKILTILHAWHGFPEHVVCYFKIYKMKSNSPNKLFRFNLWHRLIEDFRLLFSLIKDYYSGAYRDVSIGSIIVFIFGLAYTLFPADLLPDTIPGIGQVDDAAVLFLCLYFLEKDLYRYKEWKDNSG